MDLRSAWSSKRVPVNQDYTVRPQSKRTIEEIISFRTVASASLSVSSFGFGCRSIFSNPCERFLLFLWSIFPRFIFYFLCMNVFPTCMCMCHVCSAVEARREHQILETGVIDGFEPPVGAGHQTQVLCKSNQCI